MSFVARVARKIMIERRPLLDAVTHLVLIVGVVVIIFPIYMTFIGSTQTAEQISSSNPLSLLPGDIEYESPSGNSGFISPAIVISIILTLVFYFLR